MHLSPRMTASVVAMGFVLLGMAWVTPCTYGQTPPMPPDIYIPPPVTDDPPPPPLPPLPLPTGPELLEPVPPNTGYVIDLANDYLEALIALHDAYMAGMITYQQAMQELINLNTDFYGNLSVLDMDYYTPPPDFMINLINLYNAILSIPPPPPDLPPLPPMPTVV